MNSFLSKNSVLVLDNAKIHHDQELIDYLDAFGVKVPLISILLRECLFYNQTIFEKILIFCRY